MIIPNKVRNNTNYLILLDAVAYCKNVNATEIYNIAGLGEGDYRIMYYVGEEPARKMQVVILKVPTT